MALFMWLGLALVSVWVPFSVGVPVYGKFEACAPVQSRYRNPFNYSEVAVRAAITGPDGTVKVDGFYYQGYTRSFEGGREHLSLSGSPEWCVRYSPRHSGSFSVSISLTNSTGTFPLLTTTFSASQASNAKGFIHLSKNGIHFQFDNGSTYFPIGENVCWVTMEKGTYDYDNYFGKLSSYGANYARLWLTDSGWDDLAVEIAVANFSLPNTWRLDYVVGLAESRGLHLLMCTESFNYFCTKSSAPCNWNECYYNKRNGGFLNKPEDFFTSAEAKADYKNRLRYLVARYGYSTAVFAWEFFNEVDITDGYQSSVQTSWNSEMASYLHSVDVYGHLISTSYSNSDGDSAVQALPALDFTMTHNYGSTDIATQTAQYPLKKVRLYKKPSYVAEFGVADNSREDQAGVSLHNGLWAPLFSLGAGTCMTWWWDSWVEPNNLYPIFLPFSRFVASLPLAQFSWTVAPVTSSVSSVRAWGMVGEREGEGEEVLVWVQDDCFTWPAQHEGKQCEAQTSVTVTVQGCSEGTSYSSEWHSTRSGEVVHSGSAQCSGSKITDQVPTFTADIAVVYSRREILLLKGLL